MNKDIRLATTFFHHRKTKKLFRSLGDHGVICLLKLWTRVALEKPSGILTNWDIDDIELEADYDGEAGLFVEQLISLGFMEEVDGVFILHNWEDRQGWVCKSEERGNKARLSRMAKTHKEIYSELINKGVTSITRDEYVALTNRQRSVNVSLTPAPSPSPSPSPSPKPKDNTPLPPKGGKENREKGKDAINLPDWIDPILWQSYLEIRKKKRAANTPHALNLIIKKLAKYKTMGHDPTVILEESVMSGWAGVFEPKGKSPPSGISPGQQTYLNAKKAAKDLFGNDDMM